MKKAAIIVAALVITLVQLAEQRSTAQLGVGTGQTSTANNAKVDPLIVNHFKLRGGLKPIPVVITYKADACPRATLIACNWPALLRASRCASCRW